MGDKPIRRAGPGWCSGLSLLVSYTSHFFSTVFLVGERGCSGTVALFWGYTLFGSAPLSPVPLSCIYI